MSTRASALVAAVLSVPALAAAAPGLIPYVEAGLGSIVGGCLHRSGAGSDGLRVRLDCTAGPVAVLAAGLRLGDTGLRVQWEHWSAPADSRDRGAEMITIRYRYEWR